MPFLKNELIGQILAKMSGNAIQPPAFCKNYRSNLQKIV